MNEVRDRDYNSRFPYDKEYLILHIMLLILSAVAFPSVRKGFGSIFGLLSGPGTNYWRVLML